MRTSPDFGDSIADASAAPGLDGPLERSAELFRRFLDLRERLDGSRSESERVRQEAWAARLRARAVRDQAAALRDRFDEGVLGTATQTTVRWFSVTGILNERVVWARWARGRLRCHPDLMTHARLLVELGTVFANPNPPAAVEATVTGDPAAVMLTLAQACDRVISVDFSRDDDA